MFCIGLVGKNKISVPGSWRAGFSLLELLVSISIVTLVLGIVLTRHGAFNSAVLLRGQAYEIALDIRQLQLGAVNSTNQNTGRFGASRGVYFNTTALAQNSYYFFEDADGNNWPASNGSERLGPIKRLDPRFVVDGSWGSDDVVVMFTRPNLDAVFYNGASTRLNQSAVEVDIMRRDAVGTECGIDKRTIEITNTGQISVLECP